MLTRIDHVMICMPDLEEGIAAFRRIGFTVTPGGVHPGKGTHNAIAFHREDYLELLSVHDRAEQARAASAPGSLDGVSSISSRGAAASATSSFRATICPPTCSRCGAGASR